MDCTVLKGRVNQIERGAKKGPVPKSTLTGKHEALDAHFNAEDPHARWLVGQMYGTTLKKNVPTWHHNIFFLLPNSMSK
jgi:hypothetical protein